jgi:cobalt-zinc-cadmium efflux system outer membrane protein
LKWLTRKTDCRSVFVLTWIAALSSPATAHAGEGVAAIEAALRACTGPAAAAARARQLVADAAVAEVEVLPNPLLSAQHQRSFTGERDHETVAGISVPLGIGGRRFVLQDAARAHRLEVVLGARADRFDIALEVRASTARAALASARVAVVEEQRKAIAQLIARFGGLREGGETASYDVLRLETQLALLAPELSQAEAERDAESAWLEAMVGAPVSIGRADLERLDEQAGELPRRAAHPRVAALRSAAEAKRLQAQAAERRGVPDLELFAGYRMVGGDAIQTGHGMSLGLSLPFTLFDHGQGQARRARAEGELSTAQADTLARRMDAGPRAARARLAALARTEKELDRAIEGTERWLESAAALFSAGEGSLLDVLEAFRARAQARLARLEVKERKIHALVGWMQASGRLLDARLERACGAGGGR